MWTVLTKNNMQCHPPRDKRCSAQVCCILTPFLLFGCISLSRCFPAGQWRGFSCKPLCKISYLKKKKRVNSSSFLLGGLCWHCGICDGLFGVTVAMTDTDWWMHAQYMRNGNCIFGRHRFLLKCPLWHCSPLTSFQRLSPCVRLYDHNPIATLPTPNCQFGRSIVCGGRGGGDVSSQQWSGYIKKIESIRFIKLGWVVPQKIR